MTASASQCRRTFSLNFVMPGDIGSFELFLADLQDGCLGRMGSNDHNLSYGMYVNSPIWIQLAVVPAFRESFSKQIRMMVFHETAHFRWISDGLRSEHLAHARGVASLRSEAWPAEPEAMADLLEHQYPEGWCHEEIRSLIKETKGGARLVKTWGEKIARHALRTKLS